jgi:hypothetical protein
MPIGLNSPIQLMRLALRLRLNFRREAIRHSTISYYGQPSPTPPLRRVPQSALPSQPAALLNHPFSYGQTARSE